MSSDIYPLIPPVRFIPFRSRRVLVLVAGLAFYHLFLSPPPRPILTTADPTGPALVGRSSSSELPLPASPTEPLPQSPVQVANEARLSGLVESTTSSYDSSLWESFKPPAYSFVRDKQTLYPSDAEDEPGSVVEGHVPVTAVLLSWKRRRGLQLVLGMVTKHPFVREIIVWNNNVDVNVQPSDFASLLLGENPPHLRIVNSPSNVHDLAKHSACSLATYSTCYFNDDDWLNIYMDSMYTEYVATGGESNPRIVSNTMPIIHLEHRRWRFWNPDVDLHAGFTWLGTGSFVPKSLSVRFLQQVSSLPVHLGVDGGGGPLSPEKLALGDMFFSLWTNTWPHQMPNELVPIDVEGDEVGWSRGKDVDQWAIVYANILDAARRLYSVLVSRDPYLTPYPFHRSPPRPPSDSRAPCGNDECLFITSFDPFPSPSDVAYVATLPSARRVWWDPRPAPRPSSSSSPAKDGRGIDPFRIGHVKDLEAMFDAVDREGVKWPDGDWWVKNGSWHLAVDGRLDHCWDSGRGVRRGDYFGLHFTTPMEVSDLVVAGGGALKDLERAWQVETVAVGSADWTVRSISKVKVVGREVSLALVAATESELVRKLRFRAKQDCAEGVQVCRWEIDDWST